MLSQGRDTPDRRGKVAVAFMSVLLGIYNPQVTFRWYKSQEGLQVWFEQKNTATEKCQSTWKLYQEFAHEVDATLSSVRLL